MLVTKFLAVVLCITILTAFYAPLALSQVNINIAHGSNPSNLPGNGVSSTQATLTTLRVMPIGDSITKGSIGSADEDEAGFRKELYNMLRDAGYSP